MEDTINIQRFLTFKGKYTYSAKIDNSLKNSRICMVLTAGIVIGMT